MKEIQVYVWWTTENGKYDGYDDVIEVSDEEYEILGDIDAYEMGLDEIEDLRIKDRCAQWYDGIVDSVYRKNMPREWEIYEEECYLEPGDEEYDPDEEEDQYRMSEKQWWKRRHSVGVRIDEEFFM